MGLFESGRQLTIQLHSTVQGRYKRHPFFEAICESMPEENTEKLKENKKRPRGIGPHRFSPPPREQNILRSLKIRAQVV